MRVNLILVPVVVRDSNGKLVTNLKKEDSLLTDERKPRVISTVSVESSLAYLRTLKMDSA